jgi:hypothetical protein
MIATVKKPAVRPRFISRMNSLDGATPVRRVAVPVSLFSQRPSVRDKGPRIVRRKTRVARSNNRYVAVFDEDGCRWCNFPLLWLFRYF